MKKTTQNNRTLIIFFLLITYVILQFFWWGYHIVSLTQQINADEYNMSRTMTMILGEAIVFLLIVSIGAFCIIRSYYKEIELVKKEKLFPFCYSRIKDAYCFNKIICRNSFRKK